MRVVIFGATGLLGNALMRQWTSDEVVGLGSCDADIRSPQQVESALARRRPDWVVLAAAYTDVDGCENHRDLALEVNCAGAANVARAAAQIGSKLIFLSSDYVFDGSKESPYETDDPVSPGSVYGQTKAAAEAEIHTIVPQSCILRTSWVFGIGGKCFPDTILRLASSRESLDVVNDQRGCPTYTVDLARAIIALCRENASGIVHATNSGDCTWFEFATAIVAAAGLKTKIHPTTTDRFPRPAPRPKYSVLSRRSLQGYGITMPSWQDALARYLEEREASL
ncbi:MAG TPA: dTDP-4-dehydrorhamnose reductase [Terriglobales bacterium]|nr:dTDP-4-dehydrorhamnose reductase [Terriglobales bacterium]